MSLATVAGVAAAPAVDRNNVGNKKKAPRNFFQRRPRHIKAPVRASSSSSSSSSPSSSSSSVSPASSTGRHRPTTLTAASASAAADAPSSAAPSPRRLTLPALEPVTESYWEWEGHRIRYQQSGTEGPAMVLVHGFGGNADHWRKNTPVLGRKGRVFAIDLLGYGYSSKPNPLELEQNAIYNFETWSRQLQTFITEVVGEPSFIMCNSVGGVAGLQAAVDGPDNVRGVVLINPSLRGLHVKKQPDAIKPFVKALQRVLRTTDIGRKFFGNVAQAKTVKNILKVGKAGGEGLCEAAHTGGIKNVSITT